MAPAASVGPSVPSVPPLSAAAAGTPSSASAQARAAGSDRFFQNRRVHGGDFARLAFDQRGQHDRPVTALARRPRRGIDCQTV